MTNVNDKWKLATNGHFSCINSDESSPVRLLVWVGGKNIDDPTNCDLTIDELKNGNIQVYILAENDFVVEEKILYTIECVNKSLTIKERDVFSITEILHAMPRYGKVSINNNHPLPSFHSWELKNNPKSSLPHEILKTEYYLDPEIPKTITHNISVTIQIHRP